MQHKIPAYFFIKLSGIKIEVDRPELTCKISIIIIQLGEGITGDMSK